MNKVTITLLSIFVLCVFSCKKDKGTPKPIIPTTDFREKYFGTFDIVYEYMYSTNPPPGHTATNIHTIDTYKVKIRYKITDSADYTPYPGATKRKGPTISFLHYDNDSLFIQRAIDSAGTLYILREGWSNYSGFVTADSIYSNSSEGFRAPQDYIIHGKRVL